MKTFQRGWVIAGLILSSHLALAQEEIAVNIEAQRMDQALSALAQQTGLQVMFRAGAEVEGLTSPAVSGQLSAREALDRLLANSGLRYEFVNERTVRIETYNGVEHPVSMEEGAAHTNESIRVAQLATSQSTAQGQEQNPAVANSQDSELEEIVVTAQKRTERLIDTPQSISVLSADTLAKLGATQFRDFANTVPGLTYTTSGAGSTQVALRGVTVGLDIGPTVGVYVDDVPYGSSSSFAAASGLALDVGLFDVDRIEVLRGPQGTLYGASTMGGLLKYVGKRPSTNSFDVETRMGVSATHDGGVSYDGAIAVNAPLAADKAALRASAFYSRDGGYIDNVALDDEDINSADIYGARADLLLTPTDQLSIRIGGFLQNISRDGNAAADIDATGTPIDGDLEQRRGFGEPFEQRFRLVSGTIAYDLGTTTLTSISSYQTVRAPWIVDFTGFFGPAFPSLSVVAYSNDISTDKFTQELRFASDGSQPLEWLIGGFYTHETSSNEQAFVLRDLNDEPAPNDLLTYSAPSSYEEIAAFADATFHLTPKFDVSGGIRYANNRQTFTQNATGAFGAALTTPTGHSDEDVLTYLANVRYHFSDRAIGYVRYATGYRPGGPNFIVRDSTTGLPLTPATFEADRLKSYEIGYKMETVDRRFSADLATYYIDWSNIQVLSSAGGFGFKTNAPGGASVRGAELSLTARPVDAFTVTGAFAYQGAQFSETDTRLGADAGERLPNVPRFTAALNTDYKLANSGWRPTIGATLRHVSDRKASFDASVGFPQYRMPQYTTIDLRGGVTVRSVDLQLYVHNLSDERGQLSAVTNFGIPQVSILQPRTIGISALTRF